MAKYEAGREASILEDIQRGAKTIECRLNRGKFAEFRPGDRIYLRRDTYDGGRLVKSEPRIALSEVTKVKQFPSFRLMFETIDFQQAVPGAKTVEEAVAVCRQFYTPDEEAKYGTLAIYFKVIDAGPLDKD